VHVADAAALPLADEAVDLVVAFMSLQDMTDMAGAVREAARVLVPGGRLCIAIVHPINSAGEFDTRADDSPFVVRGSYLDESNYVDEVSRGGFEMTFASRHRPLEAYAAALADAGFVIEVIREPKTRGLTRRWERIPLFMYVRAAKPAR
jgi:SAM-dependent methyltransferase